MGFDPDWLALREPADRAARDAGLLGRAAAWLRAVEAPCVVDLGCGTGATRRAFAGHADGLAWRFVDNDPDLLDRAVADGAARGYRMDLRDIGRLPFAGARLVTASALLDLMAPAWLEALADRLAAEALGIYAALTYDGRMVWQPPLAADAAVAAAFNAHQRGARRAGAAAGPEAASHLAALLRARGYHVAIAAADWRLGPGALAGAHARGVAEAAGEMGCAEAEEWLQARLATGSASIASVVVGHADLLALPAGSSAQSNITSVSRP